MLGGHVSDGDFGGVAVVLFTIREDVALLDNQPILDQAAAIRLMSKSCVLVIAEHRLDVYESNYGQVARRFGDRFRS